MSGVDDDSPDQDGHPGRYAVDGASPDQDGHPGRYAVDGTSPDQDGHPGRYAVDGASADGDAHPTRYAALFARVSEGLLGDHPEPVTFERVVTRAHDLVDGCDACGITLQRRRQEHESAAATDDTALAVDRRQYELRQGPGLESTESGESLLAGDLQTDPRWPLWSPYAVERGYHSVLSIRLHSEQQPIGALNLYGTEVDAFSEDAVDFAEIFAMHAAAALDQSRLVTGLRTALRSRHVIGIAQGVLAMRYDLTYEQAFDLLRRVSSQSNVKLRDIADRVAAGRELPEDLGS